jgi:N-acetylglutamate synthase-like GNAT family acetyltransferase
VTPVIRQARAADQADITALVRRARLNPRGLHWARFLVADDDDRIVGVAQVRLHSDGARELASLVVEPEYRGYGLAGRLIDGLLSGDDGRMHMLVDRPFANHYRRWGFYPTSPRSLPGSMSRQYRIGRAVTSIGSLILRRRIRIVPLERDPGPSATVRHPPA